MALFQFFVFKDKLKMQTIPETAKTLDFKEEAELEDMIMVQSNQSLCS